MKIILVLTLVSSMIYSSSNLKFLNASNLTQKSTNSINGCAINNESDDLFDYENIKVLQVDNQGVAEKIFVPFTEKGYELYLQNPGLEQRSSTVASFVDGYCKLTANIPFINCSSIAEAIGLWFFESLWYLDDRPYTGNWKVTYGYIDGCQPQHSGICYGATYEKL